MKRFILGLAAACALATAAGAEEKPDLVTVLTSEEPQTQLMTMVLTMQSIQQGSNASILLCGPAGRHRVEGRA